MLVDNLKQQKINKIKTCIIDFDKQGLSNKEAEVLIVPKMNVYDKLIKNLRAIVLKDRFTNLVQSIDLKVQGLASDSGYAHLDKLIVKLKNLDFLEKVDNICWKSENSHIRYVYRKQKEDMQSDILLTDILWKGACAPVFNPECPVCHKGFRQNVANFTYSIKGNKAEITHLSCAMFGSNGKTVEAVKHLDALNTVLFPLVKLEQHNNLVKKNFDKKDDFSNYALINSYSLKMLLGFSNITSRINKDYADVNILINEALTFITTNHKIVTFSKGFENWTRKYKEAVLLKKLEDDFDQSLPILQTANNYKRLLVKTPDFNLRLMKLTGGFE